MPIAIKSYNTISEADAYFAARYYSESWTAASGDDKQKALNNARELIDRFRFVGFKTVSDQINEWPRSGITLNSVLLDSAIVPSDIKSAECLIAIALLSGFDPEREIRNLDITSRGYSSVRSTYDRRQTPEHLTVGIPSVQAWFYLKPFLSDASGVKINRVS